MAERESHLRAEVVEWLLEKDNPTVRYLALRHLLKREEGDAEVEQAREDRARRQRVVKPRKRGMGTSGSRRPGPLSQRFQKGPGEPFPAALRQIYCATTQLGWSTLRGRAY